MVRMAKYSSSTLDAGWSRSKPPWIPKDGPQPLLLFILAGGYDAPWRLGQRPALGELSIGGAGEVHRAAPGKQRRRPAGQEDLHHPGCTVDVVGVGTSVAKAGRATPARPVMGSACSASQAGATPVTVLARGPAAAAGRSPKAAAFHADSRRRLRRTPPGRGATPAGAGGGRAGSRSRAPGGLGSPRPGGRRRRRWRSRRPRRRPAVCRVESGPGAAALHPPARRHPGRRPGSSTFGATTPRNNRTHIAG
jgi:hypothetical protein